MEQEDSRSTRSSRNSFNSKLITTSLSQCTPSAAVQELIAAINEIVSNTGTPSIFLPKLHPLFRTKIKSIYHTNYESHESVLVAVAELIQYIVDEVLPYCWNMNLKETEIHRGGSGAFVEERVEDGNAWNSLLLTMLAGIFNHLESSVEVNATGRDVKNQANRSIVAAKLHKVLVLILIGPNSWRLPLEISYYAFDIVSDVMSSHSANKLLLLPVLPAAKLSNIIHQGYDRVLSEKALETAYRLMPLKDRLAEQTAWIQDLFPPKSSSDSKMFREIFRELKADKYHTAARDLLNTLSRNLLARAQYFTSSSLHHNSISFPPIEGNSSIDWWISRNAVAADIEDDEEERRFWFGLENVEGVRLEVQPEEIQVTFILSTPARLNHSFIEKFENLNTIVFRTTGGDTFRILKKTLLDRAKFYPKLNPTINGSLPNSSAIKFGNNTTSTTTYRRSSQAGPIAPSQKFLVPNSDDVFPSAEVPKYRDSYRNSNSDNSLEASLNTRQRGELLEKIAEVGDGYDSRATSEAGSRGGREEKENRTLIKTTTTKKVIVVEEVEQELIRRDTGGLERISVLEEKTPGANQRVNSKKTPVESISLIDESRQLGAPRKGSKTRLEETKDNPTPSQQRNQEVEKIIEIEDESELSELEEVEEEEEVEVMNPGTLIIDSSVSAEIPTKVLAKTKAKINSKSDQPIPKQVQILKQLSPPQSKRQTRSSGDNLLTIKDVEDKIESIEEADSTPQESKRKGKGKGKAVENVTTRTKRKLETPPEESSRQTRSRAAAANNTAQDSQSLTSKTLAKKSPRKANKISLPSELEKEDSYVAHPKESTPVPPAKRKRLNDPDPIDISAPTATTLVITDKSTRPNTLEPKRDVVSPIRTYGKEKKERKMAVPHKKVDGKNNSDMDVVEEEEEEEEREEQEEEREEQEKEGGGRKEAHPDSIILQNEEPSLELDEILNSTASKTDSRKLPSHPQKPHSLDFTATKNLPGKSILNRDVDTPILSKPTSKSSTKSTATSKKRANTEDDSTAIIEATKSSKASKRLTKEVQSPVALKRKQITSFSQLVAEPDPLPIPQIDRDRNRNLAPRSVYETKSNSDSISRNESVNSLDDAVSKLRRRSKDGERVESDEVIHAAAVVAEKIVARDLEEDVSIAVEKDSRVNMESRNDKDFEEDIEQEDAPPIANLKVVDQKQISRRKEKNVTAPSIPLVAPNFHNKPTSKGSSRAPISPIPPRDNLPRVLVAPTSKNPFIKSKPTAQITSRKNSITSRISDIIAGVPRSSGAGNKSKSKQVLPTKPISKGKEKSRDVIVNQGEKMNADEEINVNNQKNKNNYDDGIESILSDLIAIIAAKARDRSDIQAISYQKSVATINKKTLHYISELHEQTEEIINTVQSQLVDQQKATIIAREELKKIRNSTREKLFELQNQNA